MISAGRKLPSYHRIWFLSCSSICVSPVLDTCSNYMLLEIKTLLLLPRIYYKLFAPQIFCRSHKPPDPRVYYYHNKLNTFFKKVPERVKERRKTVREFSVNWEMIFKGANYFQISWLVWASGSYQLICILYVPFPFPDQDLHVYIHHIFRFP